MRDTGLWSGLLGLLGPNADELAALRARYGVPDAEVPSIPVRLGRGVMDVWEPLRQTYLNVSDPKQAAAYRAQRAEEERLYERGLLAGDPGALQPRYIGTLPNGKPPRVTAPPLKDSDVWRMLGRSAPAALGVVFAPELPPAEAALGLLLSGNLYDSLGALAERFAPWLEMPQLFR